eukprot:6570825-Pyramimonas_sp.AAC.1
MRSSRVRCQRGRRGGSQVLIHNPKLYNRFFDDNPDNFSTWYANNYSKKPDGWLVPDVEVEDEEFGWIQNHAMQTGIVSTLKSTSKGSDLPGKDNIA